MTFNFDNCETCGGCGWIAISGGMYNPPEQESCPECDYYYHIECSKRNTNMNLSCSIFLVNASVRAVRVSYDPDTPKANNPNRLFKTFDDSIAKDDFVVVPTQTRHGFTVCKVEEVGFRPDLSGTEKWDWVVGKVDTPTYNRLVDQEKIVLDRIGDVEYNRRKKELADAMGLAEVSLTDLDLVNGATVAIPAPSTPMGHTTVEAPPVVEPDKGPTPPERPISGSLAYEPSTRPRDIHDDIPF